MWRWEAIRHALAECQGPNSDKINFNDSQVFGDQAHHKLSADVSGRRCHPRDILDALLEYLPPLRPTSVALMGH